MVRLFQRAIDVKFRKVWLIPIFLLFPVITGIALMLAILAGEPAPDLPLFQNPLSIGYWFGYMLILGGPLQEEFGWRGYALDRLQGRYSPAKSAVILGIVWALWHLPLYFMTEASIRYQLQNILSSVVLITFLSVLFTWIYNNTGGSIFATLMFHTMLNLSTYKLFPALETRIGGLFYIVFIIVSGIAVLRIWGAEKLD